MNALFSYLPILLAAACLILLLILLFRQTRQTASGDLSDEYKRQLETVIQAVSERTERQLREEVLISAQGTRQELSASLARFQQGIVHQMTSVSTLQNDQIRAFSGQLAKLTAGNAEQLEKMRENFASQALSARQEQSDAMKRFGDTLHQTLTSLTESNAKRMSEVRQTLEDKIRELQADNARKLEEMRKTVDEKLHATLEKRLGESFRLVSERLEKVRSGIGRNAPAGDGSRRFEKGPDQCENPGNMG